MAAALLLAVVAVAGPGGADAPVGERVASSDPPRDRHVASCARQSGASFPGAFTSRDNLVAGPLSMIGARRFTDPATVTEYGGNKFPALVRARHTVTVAVTNRSAALFYAPTGDVLRKLRVEDGHRAITFRACGPRRSMSDADGRPVTFWSGFVLASAPICVRLMVWIDDSTTPRRERIPLGRRC